MGRWEPGAEQRLSFAALDLYLERGFDETTVADIAARAGVTERTFFRHFADKREVLWAGSPVFQDLVRSAMAAAPAGESSLEVVAIGMRATAELLQDRDYSRRRARAIASHPSLQERELLKLASLAATATDALVTRGVPPQTAALAAETGVAAFNQGFQRWLSDDGDPDLGAAIDAALAELRALLG